MICLLTSRKHTFLQSVFKTKNVIVCNFSNISDVHRHLRNVTVLLCWFYITFFFVLNDSQSQYVFWFNMFEAFHRMKMQKKLNIYVFSLKSLSKKSIEIQFHATQIIERPLTIRLTQIYVASYKWMILFLLFEDLIKGIDSLFIKTSKNVQFICFYGTFDGHKTRKSFPVW